MNGWLCVLLAATAADLAPREEGKAGEAFEEEIEEEVEFLDEERVRRVELPEVERRRWLVLLPIIVMVAIAWNVRRQRKGRHP